MVTWTAEMKTEQIIDHAKSLKSIKTGFIAGRVGLFLPCSLIYSEAYWRICEQWQHFRKLEVHKLEAFDFECFPAHFIFQCRELKFVDSFITNECTQSFLGQTQKVNTTVQRLELVNTALELRYKDVFSELR
jgi:hypothetical protein